MYFHDLGKCEMVILIGYDMKMNIILRACHVPDLVCFLTDLDS